MRIPARKGSWHKKQGSLTVPPKHEVCVLSDFPHTVLQLLAKVDPKLKLFRRRVIWHKKLWQICKTKIIFGN